MAHKPPAPSATAGPDAAAWARTFRPGAQNHCHTCAAGPRVVEDIRTVCRMMASGETQATWSGLRAWLVEHRAYKPCVKALRTHVEVCEPDLWRAIRDRRSGG